MANTVGDLIETAVMTTPDNHRTEMGRSCIGVDMLGKDRQKVGWHCVIHAKVGKVQVEYGDHCG